MPPHHPEPPRPDAPPPPSPRRGGRPHAGPPAPSRHAGALPCFFAPGQAAVELVALLPLVALVLALAYQFVLAGHTAWEARVAARAAARANAFGADAARAARDHLPPALERGLRVHAEPQGDVRVSLRIPRVLPGVSLGRVAATAHFRPQSG